MNNYNIDIDLLAKIAIITIIILASCYMFYRFINSKNRTLKSLINGKFGVDDKIPTVPELHFYGKSLGETISIHAFARVVNEKGYDWREIEVGYRPNFLKNYLTGRNLEIDAYHPKMKVGIEYNGLQHYKYPNIYHKTEEEFKNLQERDILKRKICVDYSIKLIEIPYYIDTCEIKNEKQVNIKRSNNHREEIIYNFIKERII